MQTEALVSKLIKLQEKAEVHSSEYNKLQNLPGNRTKASEHHRKALRLYSRIQELIREIASSGRGFNRPAADHESEVS